MVVVVGGGDHEETHQGGHERLRLLGTGVYSGERIASLAIDQDGQMVFAADKRQVLLRFRLGLPLPVGGCGARHDYFGDRVLSCAFCGTFTDHNMFRDALAAEYNRPGIRTILEPPCVTVYA